MRYALVLLALTGCATAEGLTLADGRQGYSINCRGTANNWGRCFQKAGELCPKGYEVQQQLGDQGNVLIGSATPNGGHLVGGSAISRTLIVSCK